MTNFDPYYQWLGILPTEQPPNNYRLLGIAFYESNEDVIAHAADRQMLFVRQFQVGEHQAESQRLLNEIAAAKVSLLNATAKANYDAALRRVSSPILAPALSPNDLNNNAISVVTEFEPSHDENKPSLRASSVPRIRQSAIRLAGHAIAAILGVTLGWMILLWIRGDRSISVVASPSAETTVKKRASQAPSVQTTAPSTPSHVEHQKDSAKSMTPTAPVEESTPNPPREAIPPAEPSIEQIEATRNKAVVEGDISTALVATHQMAQREGRDSIRARFDLLHESSAKGLVPQLIVEEALHLLDEAIEKSHDNAKDIASFALISARRINDTKLIRKATLGVLKTQNNSSISIGDQQ